MNVYLWLIHDEHRCEFRHQDLADQIKDGLLAIAQLRDAVGLTDLTIDHRTDVYVVRSDIEKAGRQDTVEDGLQLAQEGFSADGSDTVRGSIIGFYCDVRLLGEKNLQQCPRVVKNESRLGRTPPLVLPSGLEATVVLRFCLPISELVTRNLFAYFLDRRIKREHPLGRYAMRSSPKLLFALHGEPGLPTPICTDDDCRQARVEFNRTCRAKNFQFGRKCQSSLLKLGPFARSRASCWTTDSASGLDTVPTESLTARMVMIQVSQPQLQLSTPPLGGVSQEIGRSRRSFRRETVRPNDLDSGLDGAVTAVVPRGARLTVGLLRSPCRADKSHHGHSQQNGSTDCQVGGLLDADPSNQHRDPRGGQQPLGGAATDYPTARRCARLAASLEAAVVWPLRRTRREGPT